MIVAVKTICILFLLSFAFSCEEATDLSALSRAIKDTVPPEIFLLGNEMDTAYVGMYYDIPGAYVTEGTNRCIGAKGKVNTSVPGMYYLDYDYTDEAGNVAATVTRSVIVLENSASYLRGTYTVACLCSAGSPGSTNLVTTEQYTASISPYPAKNRFEIVSLKIGSEYVIPITSLYDSIIHIDFYRHKGSVATGTVSGTKNSFTIETQVHTGDPGTTYTCTNAFKKVCTDILFKKPI